MNVLKILGLWFFGMALVVITAGGTARADGAVPTGVPGLVNCPVYLTADDTPDVTGSSAVFRIRQWDDSGAGEDGYYWTGSAFQASDPGSLTTTQLTHVGSGKYADITGNAPLDNLGSGMDRLSVECGHALDGSATTAYQVQRDYFVATAQSDLDIITGTNGVLIDDDAITAAKIAADAIGASEIADGAIDAGAIGTALTAITNAILQENPSGYGSNMIGYLIGYLGWLVPAVGACESGAESDENTCQDTDVLTQTSTKAYVGACLILRSGAGTQERRKIGSFSAANDSVTTTRDFTTATDGLQYIIAWTGDCS